MITLEMRGKPLALCSYYSSTSTTQKPSLDSNKPLVVDESMNHRYLLEYLQRLDRRVAIG